MRLKGKIALITGAASGIGLETTKCFLREGAEVILCDINEDMLKEAAKTLEGKFMTLQLDVRKEVDWKRAVDTVREKYGKLDAFFNNAGITVCKPYTELSLEEFERVMAVNTTGPFLGIKYIAPLMAESGGGSIINAASDAATKGFVNHAAYGASKAAITMLSQVAAAEFCKQNVRSNTIHPAAVATPLIFREDEDITKDEGYFTPLGRIVYPRDVAEVVVFLASDEAGMINGAKIAIDGGGTGFQLGQPIETD
ncbi:MAG TPA: short-chain dehydrogenase [Lachnospiraceae bacterium]|jgi:NAD(P)-dependent dehydrogenase (short-subunit alcohol dehydrogenase family)|uniref:NAD(P)-dependent dehydrogenase (Short-subunit alcohol dehydrogenase family) n=2 Tax=Muricomes intestini TaxID=1796634 RepID=A0A4R3K8T7_9FIRM|nr:glucose 1-dehydrogenase [Muricomes intestini]TCS79426.1 NAD(P)-dependent dehydrogenase (short-subunit alcohol dehydrogenase family) [Muricomes intestini]HCR84013.1 short-chain dehydrogenase [Lachnospiraceae bacterium]